jgi:hypothetical protein
MSEEKVLFEMRVTEDESGTHVEVTESPEWQSYHDPRHRFFAWVEGSFPLVSRLKQFCHRPTEHELRRTLDSLQELYDDLYGKPAES